MDMAVGIIIGAAFTAIVTSLVDDLINPIISLVSGGLDFSGLKIALGDGPDAASFNYGSFITAVINFLIIAWVVFLLVKAVNRDQGRGGARRGGTRAAPAGPDPGRASDGNPRCAEGADRRAPPGVSAEGLRAVAPMPSGTPAPLRLAGSARSFPAATRFLHIATACGARSAVPPIRPADWASTSIPSALPTA